MTLYAGESAETALAEVLAPFRPDLATIAAVDAIPSDDGATPASGRVPEDWLESRRLGCARIRPTAVIADITRAESIAELRETAEIAEKALECGFEDVDAAALKASGAQGRRFTQTVAAHIYSNNYSGIRYGSRLGEEHHCIAGFVALSSGVVTDSEFIIELGDTVAIDVANPALETVAEIFGLTLP